MPTAPANRLVTIVPPWDTPFAWPESQPGQNLIYQIDVSAAIADAGDQISTVLASHAPSGSGEITISSVSFIGALISIDISGGIPTRVYWIKFDILTIGNLTFSFIVQLPISAVLAVPPISPPINPGYSSPVVS